MNGLLGMLRFGKHFTRFVIGYVIFLTTGKTPFFAYVSFRTLFALTNGRLNSTVGRLSGLLHPPYEISAVEGVIGKLDRSQITRMADRIRENGFLVFDAKLDPATCDRIRDFALSTPSKPVSSTTPRALYNRESLLATRYDFDEQEIFASEDVQQIALDSSILAVAQDYLGCRPVNDLVAMWWSAPYGSSPSSEAAQLYHFDMDRIKFMKFFVYLTDVGAKQGPHCFVTGSHLNKPKALRRDGRFSDDEINGQYPDEAPVEICGDKGTILAVDTSGFHKGKPPEEGDRLILQIEYSNNLFGVATETVSFDRLSDTSKKRVREFPYSFQRFRSQTTSR